MVIRCWPAGESLDLLGHSLIQSGAHLFLHGNAVALAEPGRMPTVNTGAALEVCATSWRRRYAGVPDPRFSLGSLASMYHVLASADAYRVWGEGGLSGWRRTAGRAADWLFEIVHAPCNERDRVETLEFVLAAAALDLEARVLFRDSGYNHLLTDAARGWAQLSDFDLMELIAEVPEGAIVGVPVSCIDATGLDAARGPDARRIVL